MTDGHVDWGLLALQSRAPARSIIARLKPRPGTPSQNSHPCREQFLRPISDGDQQLRIKAADTCDARVYDFTSIRRLTQEDPIGLAGGLNVYGFAAGDPINFSDPFGLCREGVQADSARETGTRETTIYCADSTVETRTGGTWAWRNNNPGNLRASSLAAGMSGGFAVFATRTLGNEAMWRQFRLYAARGLTLADMIEVYAPRTENDTDAYIGVVSRASGVSSDTELSSLLEIPISAIVRAMQRHEGWRPGTVTIRGP